MFQQEYVLREMLIKHRSLNALKDTKEVTEKIKNAVLGGNSTLAKDFDFIDP